MKNAFYMEGNLWLYRLYLWVAILLWLPVSLPAVDLPNLTFRTITISDGLSNNIINTISLVSNKNGRVKKLIK